MSSSNPTTNQGALTYGIDNSLASHIPTFARVCQSNVPNMNDYKISKKNTLHFRTNNIASMPELIYNTFLVTAQKKKTNFCSEKKTAQKKTAQKKC